MVFYKDFDRYKTKTAFLSDTGSVTYAELADNARQMSCVLPSRSLVMQFCENTLGSVVGYLGFLYNQAVPILLNKQIDDVFVNQLLNLYKPDYLYVPDTMKEKYPHYSCAYHAFNYSLLKTDCDYSHQLHPDLALLMSTSGSTGSPKLVRQSYQNIQANAESIADYLELNENEKPLCLLPMNYTFGLSVINSHVLVGATILLSDRSLFELEFWNLCKQQEATSIAGVPYTYAMLKKLNFHRMNLPFLRTMTQAGGRLSVELHKEFAQYAKDHNKRFFVMYGQTEATARMSYLPHEKTLEKLGSIGIAIPGGKFLLLDAESRIIDEPEIVGELVYEGPNVALGYAQCIADLVKGDELGARLQTGDMAKKDSDGYWHIVGRKKRFLKIYGNRVNLDEAEQILQGEFSFDCACVSAVDDRMNIFITLDDDEVKNDVKKFLSEKMNLHPSVFAVNFISELPKNEAGKVQYIKLEESFLKC